MLGLFHLTWYQAIGLVILLAAIAYIASGLFGLYQNYREALSLGVSIIVSPVPPLNLFWALSLPVLLPLFKKYLPFGLDHPFHYVPIDWPFHDRFRSHEKYGDAFVVVNPSWNSLYVSDAAAIDEIMSRRKDFTKPHIYYGGMEVFGPNVDTTEGADWQRHRKITTPPFNERNSGLVWKESLRQAGEMHDGWIAEQRAVTSTSADTLTLALHVLTGAGFGQQYSFKADTQSLSANHQMSYRDALCEVLRHFLVVIIFNHSLLTYSLMPKNLRRIGLAIGEFKSYMREMIDHERNLIDKRDSESGNLISSLLRASEEGASAKESLSDGEIMGNLFIYSLAGHETTANTLAFAITLLSIHPSLQDWVAEELAQVLGPASSPKEWHYHEIFPKLKRVLAIMLETLRLFPPVVALPKQNETPNPLSLTIAGKEYQIPPTTFVVTNTMAAHTFPRYWGTDTLIWDPKRWIIERSSAESADPTANSDGDSETIREPPVKGAYKPWGEGPRVCPGKKFAQVEFVAVIARLFRDWKVRPRLLEGETEEAARERVMGVVENSKVTITLQMQRSESVGLVWSRR